MLVTETPRKKERGQVYHQDSGLAKSPLPFQARSTDLQNLGINIQQTDAILIKLQAVADDRIGPVEATWWVCLMKETWGEQMHRPQTREGGTTFPLQHPLRRRKAPMVH